MGSNATAAAVKERPISFTGEMVRQILAGNKSVTRRVCKLGHPAPDDTAWGIFPASESGWVAWFGRPARDGAEFTKKAYRQGKLCPYGKAGDLLWVRERWWKVPEPSLRQLRDGADTWPKSRIVYDADESDIGREQNREMGWKPRPSIFLPRSASRITLRIVDVRVERVQDISEGDAIAEGCPPVGYRPGNGSPFWWFRDLWDSINGKKHPWSSNPWVYVISFVRHHG